jgi:hypothetical protein
VIRNKVPPELPGPYAQRHFEIPPQVSEEVLLSQSGYSEG